MYEWDIFAEGAREGTKVGEAKGAGLCSEPELGPDREQVRSVEHGKDLDMKTKQCRDAVLKLV